MAREGLNAADCQLLLEFGRGCGRTGLAAQAAHMRTYRELLAEAGRAAGQEATAKGPVYQMMGLAGGAAMVLLLI